MRKDIICWFIDLYIGLILIVINIYFFVFVHYKYDLSPNSALAFVTLPFAVYQIIKVFQNQPKRRRIKR